MTSSTALLPVLQTPPAAQSLGTYFLRTAISFSMLVSFPFSAFLGMHLIATIFPVDFSRAITTSENAPLQQREREKKKYERGVGGERKKTFQFCLHTHFGNIDTENLWQLSPHTALRRKTGGPEYTNSTWRTFTEKRQSRRQRPTALCRGCCVALSRSQKHGKHF